MNDDLFHRLQEVFPEPPLSLTQAEALLASGELLVSPEDILPYLQTALIDEKVLEVELDGLPTVYFSRLKDHPEAAPTEEDEEDGEDAGEQEKAKEGAYLWAMSHLVVLPLEPGLGNLHLRNSRSVMLRMFTNRQAVEMASSFVELLTVEELPVLCLAFPHMARLVENAREYRAKVPDSLNISLTLTLDDEEETEIEARPADVSVRGLSLSMRKKEQRLLQLNRPYSLKLYVDDELLIRIDATVRHLSRLRKRATVEYLCGFEYEFRSKTQTAVVESIVALVQRAHLKDLAAKAQVSGIPLIT